MFCNELSTWKHDLQAEKNSLFVASRNFSQSVKMQLVLLTEGGLVTSKI